MTARKPYADALRALDANFFNKPGVLAAFDHMLDLAGVARQSSDSQSNSSTDSGLPPGYLAMLARIESGNRPYVKAKTSSASGLYQFIRSTWRAEGGKWGPDMTQAFGGLRPPISEQDERATSFTLKNAAALRAAGIPINSATLYAAHFLGVGTAIKMLRAPLISSAASVAGAAAARANPTILGPGKTVASFRRWLANKTGVTP